MDGDKKKIDQYETVDELIDCQKDRIKYISDALNLVHDQQYLKKDILKAMNLIKQITSNIKYIKLEAEKAKALTAQIETLWRESQCEVMEAKLTHMENNLPDKFNKMSSFEEDYNKENILCEPQEMNSLTPLPIRRHLDFVEPSTPSTVGRYQQTFHHKDIPYLTQSEFIKIPSYMRGRVTYETVNSFIDKLNKCVADKYTLLHTSKAAIKKRCDLDKISIYKRQECPKTKGKYFITQDDLKLAMGGKIDKHTLNLIPMLRHTTRVQEVRDGGIIRYIAITEIPHS